MGRKESKREDKKEVPAHTKKECRDCAAKCCHDLVLAINKPRTQDDIAYYRWHLQYDTVRIAISNHKWHTVFEGRCIYLDKNNICTIYDRRPEKCRRHNPPECEHFSKWYDIMLSTPEELDAHLEKEKRRRKRAAARRRKAAAARKA